MKLAPKTQATLHQKNDSKREQEERDGPPAGGMLGGLASPHLDMAYEQTSPASSTNGP